MKELAKLPLVMTVTEAATVLRVSPSQLYELCARYRASDGREGFPCVTLGRGVRIPRHLLENFLSGVGRAEPVSKTRSRTPNPGKGGARLLDTERDQPIAT